MPTATTEDPCECCECIAATLECATKGGLAEMCGFSEFADASSPPKKYRIKTTTGSLYKGTWSVAGCPGPASLPGSYSGGFPPSDTGFADASGSMTAVAVDVDTGANKVKYKLTSKSWANRTYEDGLGNMNDIRLVARSFDGGTNEIMLDVDDEVWLSRDSAKNPFTFFIQGHWSLGGWVGNSTTNQDIDLTAQPADLIRDDWDIVDTYDPDTCDLTQEDNSERYTDYGDYPLDTGGSLDGGGPSLTDFTGLIATSQDAATRTAEGTEICSGGSPSSVASGEHVETLTDEDTEEDANERLLAAEDWSDFTPAGSPGCINPLCCLAEWEARESGFTYTLQAAKFRVRKTGLTPSAAYTPKVLIFRRAGLTGPFTLYQTWYLGNENADGSGNLLSGEYEVPNEAGYQTYAGSCCVTPVS